MKCILRLDDITESSDWSYLSQVEKVLDKYNIKPLIGVVPINGDKKIIANNNHISRNMFFSKVKKMQEKGYTIAMHGVYHSLKNTSEKSIVDINSYGELTDLCYQDKYSQLNLGLKTLNDRKITTNVYMPPAHWIDKDTIDILKKNGFKYVTDGLFAYPRKIDEMWFIPQQMWRVRRVKIPGIFTICLHINNETQASINNLIDFLEENHNDFVDFYSLKVEKYENIFCKFYNFVTGVLLSFYLKKVLAKRR